MVTRPANERPMSESVRIAAIQHDIVWNDRQANFDRVTPMIAAAAGAGARIVLCTEMFSTGFVVDVDGFGEPEGGPSSTFLLEQAAAHGIWVGGTCAVIPPDASADDRRPWNCFVLAGPDGTVHRYRKIHPFTYGGEDRRFRAGDELVTVEAEGLRLSLFVCYDLRFADEFWQVAAGTDVYLLPANWPATRRLHWQALLQARAIENQAYVVGANRVGEGGGLAYSGDTRIIDPLGEVLAGAAHTESIVLADVSRDVIADVRQRFPFLADRR
jgi:predicted amidohydrolase